MQQQNIEFMRAQVQHEREQILAKQDAGDFCLREHIANHPISKAMKAGLSLRDNHPAMVLRRRRELKF